MVKGWEEVELLSLSNGGMQNGVFYEVFRKGSGVPLINVGDMYTQIPLTSKNLESFDATDNEIKRFAVEDGDLFFTRSSVVPSGIAFCNWYKKTSSIPVVFDSHVIRFKTDKNKVVPMFLYLQCVSPKVRGFFTANAKTAAMTTIDQLAMGKCLIDLPPLPEQHAIATALSGADAYIAALEKLIAKKRNIKQGAMQELLTGKRRLPGFSGEWVKKSLLDCVDLLQGLTYSPINVKPHGLLVLRSSNIKNGKLIFNDCVHVDCMVDESRYVTINDILICVRNGSGALIGKSCVIDHAYNATFGAFMSVLRGDITGYIAHAFSSDIVQNQIRNRSSATINQITKRDFENIIISLPDDLAEQSAIAAVLSDMDSEIDGLLAKLNKAKQIKQGMMNELLTGRIRLL